MDINMNKRFESTCTFDVDVTRTTVYWPILMSMQAKMARLTGIQARRSPVGMRSVLLKVNHWSLAGCRDFRINESFSPSHVDIPFYDCCKKVYCSAWLFKNYQQ